MKKLAILLTVLFATVSVYAGEGYSSTNAVTENATVSVRVINPLTVVAPNVAPGFLPVVIDNTERPITGKSLEFTINGEAGEDITVSTAGFEDGAYTCPTTKVKLLGTWAGSWGDGTVEIGSGDEFSLQNATYTFTPTALNAKGEGHTTGTATFTIAVKAEYNDL